jgi:nucleoid DNA-binding protein
VTDEEKRNAKRLHEAIATCPACAADIRIARAGWAFGADARETPLVDDVECAACERYFERFDARALVDQARALDGAMRAWLQAYTRATDWLGAEIRAGEVVATCLGTFYTVTLAAYAGRNPRTGEAVAVPEKRRRAFAPSAELVAACALPAPRPLTRADLEDDELLRRADEHDDAPVVPPPTKAVDLSAMLDVLAAELIATGAAGVGEVGTLERFRQHDERRLFTAVRLRFRRSMEP